VRGEGMILTPVGLEVKMRSEIAFYFKRIGELAKKAEADPREVGVVSVGILRELFNIDRFLPDHPLFGESTVEYAKKGGLPLLEDLETEETP
jgi:hypothetical protein